jgi:hypothetical protein
MPRGITVIPPGRASMMPSSVASRNLPLCGTINSSPSAL